MKKDVGNVFQLNSINSSPLLACQLKNISEPLHEKNEILTDDDDEGDLFRRHRVVWKNSAAITCRSAWGFEWSKRKNYFWDMNPFSSEEISEMISWRAILGSFYFRTDVTVAFAVVRQNDFSSRFYAGGGEKADFSVEAINAYEG